MKTLICIASLVISAPVALADVSITYTDGQRIHTREISFSPVASQADAELLYVRLQRVAKQVCDRSGPTMGLARANEASRACEAQALEQAVDLVSDPRVTAFYKAKR